MIDEEAEKQSALERMRDMGCVCDVQIFILELPGESELASLSELANLLGIETDESFSLPPFLIQVKHNGWCPMVTHGFASAN